ncbi:MAG: antitoxin [Thaumarchaeota archaeon]|nr:antitoxin [Nitrososphaerota archaeon]
MTSKNVSIREDVYRKLAEAKHEDESFSDVIERILEKRASLLSLWGTLAKSEALPTIERDIKEVRRKTVIRQR